MMMKHHPGLVALPYLEIESMELNIRICTESKREFDCLSNEKKKVLKHVQKISSATSIALYCFYITVVKKNI